jgi:ribosome biogenesis GTPase
VENHKGFLVDTPGFSLLDFERFHFMDKEELVYAFPEYASLAGECKYKKCTHTKEEGCRILEETNMGHLPLSRHESYVAIWDDLKKYNAWDKKN